MELRDYLVILRRNWLVILVITLTGLMTGGAASLLTKPVYEAETQLFVATQNSESIQDLQSGNSFIQARVSSYVKTATTPTVLQPAIDALGLAVSAKELASKVTATSDLKTVIISLTVQDSSPVQAASIAQAIATSLITAVDDLEMPSAGGDSPVRISIVAPATAPTDPTAPNTKANLALGIISGFVVGILGALLRSTLDTRIRNERDLVAITSTPVLGGIAFDPGAVQHPLASRSSGTRQRAESFLQLRTNLQFAHVSHKKKTVLVTSSLPGEGKSSTAVNLAIAMAEAGQTVALIDADLRRPMIAAYLGLEGQAGLTTALIGQADVHELLQPWGTSQLHVLTSGRIPPNPSELLGSPEMAELISRLEQTFDYVIIDAPPLLPVTDAAVLAQQVGGVLVVVGCHSAKRPQIEKALSTLKLVKADILGIVLNRVTSKGAEASSYDYYGSAATIESPGFEGAAIANRTNLKIATTEVGGGEVIRTRASRRSRYRN